MKQFLKRFLAILLMLQLTGSVFSEMSMNAVAAGEAYIGDCGDNLLWTFYSSTGLLSITGTGEMEDYSDGDTPWCDHCDAILTVEVQYGVTHIGNYAFKKCYNLNSVTISNRVSSIGDDAFIDCANLTSVYYSGTQVEWDSIEIGNSNEYLIAATIHYTMPSVTWCLNETIGVLSITGTGAMEDYSPGAAPWYDDRAFIKTVIVDSGVTTIGNNAFRDCTSLTDITISSDVTSIHYNAFKNCIELKTVKIPNSVTSIELYAFEGCTGLKSLMIPNSVTQIGSSVFSGCTGLTAISVQSGNSRYSNDDYGVLYDKAKTKLIQYPIGNERTSFSIPNSVEVIGYNAFEGCINLIGITIPNGVTSIGNYSFAGCSSLMDVTIPEGVTSIGNCSFSGCSSLLDITIPDGVTSIGYSSFRGCTKLENITIPGSVTSIGSHAFSGCTELTNATIPDSVMSIEWAAFSDCTKLANITIPNGLTTIEQSMFENCASLTSVTIPNGITIIKKSAFANCIKLKSVTIPNSVTSIEAHTFERCTSLVDMTIPDSVMTIGREAFYSCSDLSSIVIPDSVTTIEQYAFGCCTGLTNVTIPDSVTEIGEAAFLACTKLTSVTIPDNVTRIENLTFWCCESLLNVIIGNDVKTIGDYAFIGCQSLTSVTIPNSVKSIGRNAFSGCDGLKKLIINNRFTTLPMDDVSCVPKYTLICGPNISNAQKYAERYGRDYLVISEKKELTLTFNASQNGGTLCVDGNPGVVVEELTEESYGNRVHWDAYPAKKDGWTFIGWNRDPSATEAEDSSYRITKSVTFYAIFKKKGSVTCNYLDGTSEELSRDMFGQDIRIRVTLPKKDIPDYTIGEETWKGIGWTTSTAPSASVQYNPGQEIYIEPDQQLYALYEQDGDKRYTVLYSGDGMENVPSQTEYLRHRINAADAQTTCYVLRVTETTPVPTGLSYVFAGWAFSQDTSIDDDRYFAGEEILIENPEAEERLYGIKMRFRKTNMRIDESERYGFSNDGKNFSSDYALPQEWLDDLQDMVSSEAEYTRITSESMQPWRGSCFGMCATMALFKAEKLDNIRTDLGIPTNLSSVDKPNDALQGVINYYQMLQYTEKGAAFRFHNVNDTQTSPKQLRLLVQNLIKSEYPVLFTMTICAKGNLYSHALLAHHLKQESDGSYCISIMDPTDPRGSYSLIVSKDFKNASFDLSWNNSYEQVLGENISYFAINYSDTVENSEESFNCYSLQDLLYGKVPQRAGMKRVASSRTVSDLQISESAHATFLTTGYLNFTITRSDGAFAVVENGTVTQGALPVEFYSVNNEIGTERSVTFMVPTISGEDYYIILPSKQEVSIVNGEPLQWFETSLFNNDPQKGFYLSVCAEEAGQIELYADGRIVTIYDEDVQQRITSAVNNVDALWDTLELEGFSRGFMMENDGQSSFIFSRSETTANLTLKTNSKKTKLEHAAMPSLEMFEIQKQDDVFLLKAENGELVATFASPVSVSFYTNGGTYIPGKVLICDEDGTVTIPEPESIPFRYGYAFEKWCTADGEEWHFETDRATQDIRLYAQWKQVELIPGSSGIRITDEGTVRISDTALNGVLQNVSATEGCTVSYADGWRGNGTGSEIILSFGGKEVRKYNVDVIGDVNGDGEVNLKDAVILKRLLAGWDVFVPSESSANVNDDDEMDLRDVVLIVRYLAGGWNVVLV